MNKIIILILLIPINVFSQIKNGVYKSVKSKIIIAEYNTFNVTDSTAEFFCYSSYKGGLQYEEGVNLNIIEVNDSTNILLDKIIFKICKIDDRCGYFYVPNGDSLNYIIKGKNLKINKNGKTVLKLKFDQNFLPKRIDLIKLACIETDVINHVISNEIYLNSKNDKCLFNKSNYIFQNLKRSYTYPSWSDDKINETKFPSLENYLIILNQEVEKLSTEFDDGNCK